MKKHSGKKLVLFTRYPVPGRVKTRLIGKLGAAGAADLHRGMTEFVLCQALATGIPLQVRYTGGTGRQMRDWLGPDPEYVNQGGGNLGDRMERCFRQCFQEGAKEVAVIGSDCPDNRSSNMLHCFRLLKESSCVIGPAHDGGYYMIGLSRHRPELFRGITWGTKDVLRGTLAAAGPCSFLPELKDVDEPGDIPPLISVIVPAVNEGADIERCLDSVNRGFYVECIVVDGGSSDDTARIAANREAMVLSCNPGRAGQMNFGAARAAGDIHLFLHADSELPPDWDRSVRMLMGMPETSLGFFRFRIRDRFPGFRLIEKTANLRARFLGWPYGDQGLFVRRETFEKLGGYSDIPILEDFYFVRQAKRIGRLHCVDKPVITSGRRWRKFGILRTTLLNQFVIIAAVMGTDLNKLRTLYREGRLMNILNMTAS